MIQVFKNRRHTYEPDSWTYSHKAIKYRGYISMDEGAENVDFRIQNIMPALIGNVPSHAKAWPFAGCAGNA